MRRIASDDHRLVQSRQVGPPCSCRWADLINLPIPHG
jgi:hypothetical protein